MVVVILRAQLRHGFESEVEAIVEPARALAAATPGFVAFNRYVSEEDEQVILLEFESHEALAEWRDHPDNMATQGTGRDRLFRSYQVQVCDVVRAYELIN